MWSSQEPIFGDLSRGDDGAGGKVIWTAREYILLEKRDTLGTE